MFPLQSIELATALGVGMVPLALAWLLARFTAWPRKRVIVVSASLIPSIVTALCVYVVVSATTASAEECGVDACGMALAAAVSVFALALVALVFGMGTASLGFRWARR